jgi:hypothetical protein
LLSTTLVIAEHLPDGDSVAQIMARLGISTIITPPDVLLWILPADVVVHDAVMFATRCLPEHSTVHICHAYPSGSVKALGDTRFVNLNSTDGSHLVPSRVSST